MLNPRELMTLVLIGISTFRPIEGSHGDFLSHDCNVALNFTAVGLTSLPKGFVKNKFVTHLILDENEIQAISSEAFSSVPNLSYLSLAKNKLRTLNFHPFSKLDNLETLILNGNCKKSVVTRSDYTDDYYLYSRYEEVTYCSLQFDSHLRSLTHLFVEYNDIQDVNFPDELMIIEDLPMLTHFYLSHNPVNLDQKAMLGLKRYAPALTHFYLQYCGIANLTLSLLPTITSLYLDGNFIGSICSKNCESMSLDLSKGQKLKALSLSHNQISKIEVDAFNYTKNLLILDLSHNNIAEIEEGTFYGLDLLQSLSLEHNKLVLLGAEHALRNLNELETLSLAGNDLSNIGSDLFANLSKLRQLTLNYTKISSIDSEMFSNLINLEVFSLAGNQLSRIPEGSMPTSGSLITLNLDNNKFTNTKDISLVGQKNMLSVSLKNNPLTTLSARWIINIRSENLTISLGSSSAP